MSSPTSWKPRNPYAYAKWKKRVEQHVKQEEEHQRKSGYIWDDDWNCYRKLIKGVTKKQMEECPVRVIPSKGKAKPGRPRVIKG